MGDESGASDELPLRYANVEKWRSAPLGEAGDGLKVDLLSLDRSREEIRRRGVPATWSGRSADEARKHRDRLVADLDQHMRHKEKVKTALYRAETDVRRVERLLHDVRDHAAHDGFSVDEDGIVHDIAEPPTFQDRTEAEDYHRRRNDLADGIARDIKTAMDIATNVDLYLARTCSPTARRTPVTTAKASSTPALPSDGAA